MRVVERKRGRQRWLESLLAAALLAGCGGSDPGEASAANSTLRSGEREALASPLPRVTELPSGYSSLGSLAGRGEFYADGGLPGVRTDDGDHYHGYDGPVVWAQEPKGVRTQGVVYGVEDGSVVSAGYLIGQGDLVASKSFHGLTLRELDFPPARSMTVDFLEGAGAEADQYLMLWHFRPTDDPDRPMLPLGRLPELSILPEEFSAYACTQFPDAFCPGMGRHYTDLTSVERLPEAVGNEGVIYGEAAGKLIFIEYILTQESLAAGVSWPAMPLDDLPIPPIDNAHVLHFELPGAASGLYTVHMYFLPEDIYLGWETEPEEL